jgi:molybdate transport system substrate-binding protein
MISPLRGGRRTRTRSVRCAAALLTCLFISTASGFSSGTPGRSSKADLTISAAISVKDALDEITRLYTSQHPGVSIATNYGASGTLQLQIEQGAPVDIFLSAAPKQMDALESKGLLLEGTRRNLLLNQVVLIVPKDSTAGIATFQDLLKPAVKKVAVGEPVAVPAGKYAQEVLTNLGIYSQINAKTVLAKDVRQVLTYVETGDVDAGVVYATDALSSSKVRVVAQAPANSHSPVVYPIAIIKDSKNAAAAREFEAFLASAQARGIFQKHGFRSANP